MLMTWNFYSLMLITWKEMIQNQFERTRLLLKKKKKKQQDPPLYTPFKLGHEAWKLWHVNEISLLSS